MDHSGSKVTDITNGSKILSVAFTTDGKHIVAGDEGRGIRRWKIEDARQVGTTMTTPNQPWTVAVSPDAQWIVTGDWGGKVIVWNSTTHQKVLEITDCQGAIVAVDISSDSARIAAGSNEKRVRIFSITTGAQLVSLQHDNSVVGLKFSPSGDQIATATYYCASVRIYNSQTGDKLFDIPVHVKSCPITPLAWSPNGQQVFAISPGKITCLNTSTTARSEWSIPNAGSNASIVTNGKFLACSAGAEVSFWDIDSHQQIGRILELTTEIVCIDISPDGEYLACGNERKISLHRISDILPTTYVTPPASRPPLMEVSFAAIEPWMQDDMKSTETILSEEIGQVSSNPHALANRALIRARLKRWNTALEDANMSLKIKNSPIGYISKALALVGVGEKNLALSELDFAFGVCDLINTKFLLVIKSIVIFGLGNHEDAIFRVSGLIAIADEDTQYYCSQVLGNMYLQKRDYEGAIRSLHDAPRLATSGDLPQLTTISLIFGWSFHGIEVIAWTRLCETLHSFGRTKEVGETLLRMVNSLTENDREAAHCRILEEIVRHSGDVALLSWTGPSSTYNSCLPASPVVYTQTLFTPPILDGAEMESRTTELRTTFSEIDALIIHACVTRLQPVRFANHRLLLPCLPFHVRSLSKNEEHIYSAKVTWLGDVEFTTEDAFPVNEPRRLVFVHPWIRRLCDPYDDVTSEDDLESDTDTNSNKGAGSSIGSDVDIDAEIVHASLVEEVPSAPPDTYTRALQLIVRLGQPFNALLLLKQSDGTYKRVAAEHEIVVSGLASNVPKDIRAEVLEIV